MADVFHPRFAKPTVLRAVEPALLVRLLKPYREWLEESGIKLRSVRDLNDPVLDKLSLALMDGSSLPPGLPELQSLLDDMSRPALFDRLLECAKKAKLVLPENVTGIDLAVRLYLKAPQLLEGVRVEVASLKPRKISRYMALTEDIPPVPRDVKRRRAAFETALQKDFVSRKRGTGTRVHLFYEPNGFRLMIRRGDTLRSQAVIDDDDETRRLILRPELYDVVRYDMRHGDLLVNARAKGDAQAYCRLIGRHLFKSDFLFDAIETPPRYSLDPILSEGQAVLTCAEFEQIEYVSLCVLDLEHPTHDHVRLRLGPDDVFTALQLTGGAIDPDAVLTRAQFKIKLFDEKRERSVIIIPPITAIYEHDEIAEVIEKFIERRGLLLPRTESLNACADTLFTMS
jgi:hypothetical protein